MTEETSTSAGTTGATVYQIRVKGHLGDAWSDWFEGLTITLETNGETLLTGTISDQAALHGLIKKVRDLGMPLISVIPVTAAKPTIELTTRKPR